MLVYYLYLSQLENEQFPYLYYLQYYHNILFTLTAKMTKQIVSQPGRIIKNPIHILFYTLIIFSYCPKYSQVKYINIHMTWALVYKTIQFFS